MKYTKGLTIYVCIGRFAKLQIEKSKNGLRICLGFISFSILFIDLEILIKTRIGKI